MNSGHRLELNPNASPYGITGVNRREDWHFALPKQRGFTGNDPEIESALTEAVTETHRPQQTLITHWPQIADVGPNA